ncbi:hypothetical protein [Streptomyces sp. N35]|uniref:hypothetical protein n=1 Tax=Streptomyces sp. N35 TaxID=2795730 RepID=UPI0018F6CA82|nr:hypothetical protein [Streptomyces sp. N35]
MKSFKVKWVQDGTVRTSVVSYDAASAEARRAELAKPGSGATDVEVVPVAADGRPLKASKAA